MIGLAIGLVGIDTQSGQARLTFGIPTLLDGIDVVLVVGRRCSRSARSFGHALDGHRVGRQSTPLRGRAVLSREDFRRSWPAWLRGTAIGFPIGALPAGGAEIPTFLSYATEKKLSKHPEEFGHGAIEGVAGPEAANNAAAAGVLVPLLTLGLPTSATAAIILAAFQSLRPAARPAAVLRVRAAGVGADRVALHRQRDAAGAEPAAGQGVGAAAEIPACALYAGILVFAALGAFAAGGSRRSTCSCSTCIGLLGVLMRGATSPSPRRWSA